MHPIDKAARVGGAVYLSLVLTAPFSLLYVPGKLIVRGFSKRAAGHVWRAAIMLWLLIKGAKVPVIESDSAVRSRGSATA